MDTRFTDAAQALIPLLEGNAAESERLRHVAPESVQAMKDAGLWRLITAQSNGGSEAGLRAQVDTLFMICAADPAAGWVQMVSNAHSWMVGNFPAACQSEVFANGPDCRVPGTLASQGRAVKVDGGWRLDGRWQFASGVDHGDWLLIGAIADLLPESPTRLIHVIVPKADITAFHVMCLGLQDRGGGTVVVQHRGPPVFQPFEDRRLFHCDPFDIFKGLKVGRCHSRDHRHMRSCEPGQRSDFTRVIHADLDHCIFSVGWHPRQRQGHAPMVVITGNRGMGAALISQHCAQHFLG